MLKVAIIGFGGHSRVVAASLRALGRDIVAFTTRVEAHNRSTPVDGILLSDEELIDRFRPGEIQLVLGIGSIEPNAPGSLLPTVVQRFDAAGYQFTGFIHPAAFVADDALIHPTSQIHAGAVVQSGAKIGAYSIINTGTIVEHDCHIGDFCHLAPRTTLSGDVTIQDGTHLGTACCVIQGRTVGKYSLVAAGAVVVKDLDDGSCVKGVPAKPFSRG